MGNQRLWKAMTERDKLYEKPDMSNEDGMRLGELEGIVGEEDGYSAESNAAVLLQGLDIPDELHERKMAELQGGQKVRVLLAQALFGSPTALLLDEPTNHLDLDSIHWLEGSSSATTARSSSSRTTATSSTRCARTSPTSTTRRSSPTPAATTTW
jgi:ATPase subunit of ABC transporter with duplicated ATPase domains